MNHINFFSKTGKHLREYRRQILWLAAIALAAFLVSRYFFQFLLIQGDSMLPAYHNMQLVILNKHNKNFVSGDVIAFYCENADAVLVKRIAAAPGDRLYIENGTLYVNDEISPIYPGEGIFAYAGNAASPLVLGAGQYFVIGDNIAESKDSRYDLVGLVSIDSVLGKIL